ncbi:DUF2190 family protein [bacterium]|nr:MAG: DUF2190 family protein [bacterium]
MSINNLSYDPLLTLTIKANEDLPANRFVDYSGYLSIPTGNALGATEIAWNSGDIASIIIEGIVIIETANSFTVGDDVCTGTGGKATTQSGTDPVVGKALDTVSSGAYLRVLLKH